MPCARFCLSVNGNLRRQLPHARKSWQVWSLPCTSKRYARVVFVAFHRFRHLHHDSIHDVRLQMVRQSRRGTRDDAGEGSGVRFIPLHSLGADRYLECILHLLVRGRNGVLGCPGERTSIAFGAKYTRATGITEDVAGRYKRFVRPCTNRASLLCTVVECRKVYV